MTQVNPIWAQVHTVAADGTTTFSDDVAITGSFSLGGTVPTTALFQSTLTPTQLTGRTQIVRYFGTFLNTTDPHGVEAIVISNATANLAGESIGVFGQSNVGTGAVNWTGQVTGVKGFGILDNTTAVLVSNLVGGEFHSGYEASSTGAVTNSFGVQAMGRHFGVGTTTNLRGVNAIADLGTSGGAVDGNVSNGVALFATVRNQATAATPGVMNQAMGLYVEVPVDSAAITANYGIRVANQGGTHSNIATSYGLVVEAQSGSTTCYNSRFRGGQVEIVPGQSIVSAAGTIWDGLYVNSTTLTLTGGVNVGSGAGVDLFRVRAPTITSASATTVTNSATVVISAAPIAAGSVTLTNSYALWIQGGTNRFDGPLQIAPTTAVTAGGSTANYIGLFGTGGVPTLGVYAGSGVPTISAGKGSLYMRTDGSSTSTRMYVNTDGATTWTNVTTGA